MPSRKEPKETVVYPASKRKAPAFKPQRPSKVPRISTTESESSTKSKATKIAAPPARRKSKTPIEDEDDSEDEARTANAGAELENSDEELDDDPLASKPRQPAKAASKPPPKCKPTREPSPMSVSSDTACNAPPERPTAAPSDLPPAPSQIDGPTSIPQPLLMRLLHEHFADKNTKIDKNAFQVLQKYFELFLRETIARAAAQKREDAEKDGDASAADVRWLEHADLEKVAAGMMLDF